MTYAFRARPIIPRRRRLVVAVLVAVALLIAAAARFVWRQLCASRDSDDHRPPDVTMPITITRLCARTGCTNPLSAGAGPRARYCSPACRTAAYRERKATA